MINPKDIAALPMFLTSDAAKSIRSQVLPIQQRLETGVIVLRRP
jgi:hypothetical protein